MPHAYHRHAATHIIVITPTGINARIHAHTYTHMHTHENRKANGRVYEWPGDLSDPWVLIDT